MGSQAHRQVTLPSTVTHIWKALVHHVLPLTTRKIKVAFYTVLVIFQVLLADIPEQVKKVTTWLAQSVTCQEDVLFVQQARRLL